MCIARSINDQTSIPRPDACSLLISLAPLLHESNVSFILTKRRIVFSSSHLWPLLHDTDARSRWVVSLLYSRGPLARSNSPACSCLLLLLLLLAGCCRWCTTISPSFSLLAYTSHELDPSLTYLHVSFRARRASLQHRQCPGTYLIYVYICP